MHELTSPSLLTCVLLIPKTPLIKRCKCQLLSCLTLPAGAFFSLFTTPVTRIGGRKLVMILGGASFCIGAILCAFAQDLAMLIIGRVCLGAGVGFANQVSSPFPYSTCLSSCLYHVHHEHAFG